MLKGCKYGQHKLVCEAENIIVVEHQGSTKSTANICHCIGCLWMGLMSFDVCGKSHHNVFVCFREPNHDGTCCCYECDSKVLSFVGNSFYQTVDDCNDDLQGIHHSIEECQQISKKVGHEDNVIKGDLQNLNYQAEALIEQARKKLASQKMQS